MSNPCVSVLIAVYNTQSYLPQCLDSVVSQTFSDFEIICIDDGSTDNSYEILQQYAGRDMRFSVYRQTNHGVGYTKNLALSLAKGKYVLFLDSDDYIEKNTLETIVSYAESTDAQIVVFPFEAFYTDELDSDEVVTDISNDAVGHVSISSKDVPSKIFQTTNPAAWNKLWLRSFLENHHIDFGSFNYAEDFYMTYWALAVAERICFYSDTVLYHYRMSRLGSLSTANKNPLGFIEAYCGLKENLQTCDVFTLVEQSYANVVLSGVAYELSRHNDETTRELITSYLKKEGFVRLGIKKQSEEYYHVPDYYDLYMDIQYPNTKAQRKFIKRVSSTLPFRIAKYCRRNGLSDTIRHIVSRIHKKNA